MITYDTGPASFLAKKCLEVWAHEVQLMDPLGASMIMNNFYMDDLLGGANTEEPLIKIQRNIHAALAFS